MIRYFEDTAISLNAYVGPKPAYCTSSVVFRSDFQHPRMYY
jgi:hypothetical protein